MFCVQHQLECALLGLGQFQNTLDELHTWLSRTAEQLQGLQPISIDLQTCEIELAKHKVSATTSHNNKLISSDECLFNLNMHNVSFPISNHLSLTCGYSSFCCMVGWWGM